MSNQMTPDGYQALKAELEELEGPARLTERLRNAEVVKEATPGGKASVGSTVELREEETGTSVTYQLVGATEADLASGRLSVESPLAQSVLGSTEGDTVSFQAPRGKRRYVVVAIR